MRKITVITSFNDPVAASLSVVGCAAKDREAKHQPEFAK